MSKKSTSKLRSVKTDALNRKWNLELDCRHEACKMNDDGRNDEAGLSLRYILDSISAEAKTKDKKRLKIQLRMDRFLFLRVDITIYVLQTIYD